MSVRSNFILGIGGVGMSALAQFLIDRGEKVAGADRMVGTIPEKEHPPALNALKNQGVTVLPDNGSGIDGTINRIIISTAIENDHPALETARKLSIPVVHRSEALSEALKPYKLLAVAGTCGKSTVTAILGHILEGAGLDPVVVNGAAIPGWDLHGSRVGSVRKLDNTLNDGQKRWAVVEVDESDKSLTVFNPDAAIITNASADHFGMEETQSLFDKFKSRVSGLVEDWRCDGEKVENAVTDNWSGSFSYNGVEYTIPQPGRHNILNACVAVKTAIALGADPLLVKKALSVFPGVARRMQKIGTVTLNGRDISVIDDYAHNTEKLHAMWTALASSFPEGVAAVWRPHGFAPLRKMMVPLAEMFRSVVRPQDRLFILPVYDAGGTAARDVSSDMLVKLISSPNNIKLVNSIEEAEENLIECILDVGALVTAGARDPALPVLAERLFDFLNNTKEKNHA